LTPIKLEALLLERQSNTQVKCSGFSRASAANKGDFAFWAYLDAFDMGAARGH
jgi:hypothetical protein